MLGCQACMKRCLQTIIGDSSFISSSCSSSLRRSFSRHSGSTSQRNLSTQTHSAASQSAPDRPVEKYGRRDKRQEWLESRGIRPADKAPKNSLKSDFVIRKHLQYLKDPLKLADHVRRMLRADNFDETLEVVRAASKTVQCTVSWNHLIDWQLSKGRMNAAIKTFNEMKKRAQVPDAYTYTIIFRGCAENYHSTQALAKVMSVYQGMLRDKSPVKPNVIHMNAVLKMCARAGDMDALFAISADLPDGGPRAANNLTYTTIINALRVQAMTEPEGGRSPMEQRAERRVAIMRARLIWQDVVTRWRKGDMWIDEELVSTMGRTLLLGGPDDIDDIFSLIEQSMNMPRQFPRMGHSHPAGSGPRSQILVEQGIIQKESLLALQSPSASVDQALETVERTEESTSVEAFTAVTPTKSPPNDVSAYAKPGQNSLSLVLQALLDLHLSKPIAKSPAANYWEMFTKKHGVVPDGENYAAYLRILRLFRASTETVEVLLQMPKSYMTHKIFRISMSTCMRDKHNRHAFTNSGKILDLMQTHLTVPDMRTLVSYLEVAVAAPAHGDRSALDADVSYTTYAQGQQIMRSLERLGPSFVNIRSFLSYGDPSKPKLDRQRNGPEFLEGVLGLTKHMIRACDILVNQALVPDDMYGYIKKQRSKLAAFVTRYKSGRWNRVEPPVTGEDAEMFDFVEGVKNFNVRISRHTAQQRHYKWSIRGSNPIVAKDVRGENRVWA